MRASEAGWAPGAVGAVLVVGLLLALLAGLPRQPPAQPVPDRDGYLARWGQLHGYDPATGSPFVRGWLSLVHLLAAPLARRGTRPDALTLLSVWSAGLVAALAALGGRWPAAAGLLLVGSGLLDSLDGGVAVLSGRTTAWGYVLDSTCDRVADALWLLAAVFCGCPAGVAAGCAGAVLLLEYLRARAGNAGGDEVAAVTVAERSTRVLVLAPTLVLAAVLPSRAAVVALAGTVVLLALTLVGLGQLGTAVRRQLRGLPGR